MTRRGLAVVEREAHLRWESLQILPRQGNRLLQLGVVLILFSCFFGFLVPVVRSERVGLSVHTLSAFEGVLLLAQGLAWTRLRLTPTTARLAFWCSIYATLAILAAYLVAAILGVGVDTLRLVGELPHGLARGTAFQETLIAVLAYSSAPPGMVAFGLMLWGLR
ncbi:MAG TPA: hypothetical protein VFV19_11480 [Candidatus Polarisedimenticolaceae bacterium]|nr:hypothetical protein [Candidatus Polarisedimenticolaceae bacterium]